MPVEVRPAFGTITLGFAWDSAGLANVVCSEAVLVRSAPLEERFDRGRLWRHGDRAGIGAGATGRGTA